MKTGDVTGHRTVSFVLDDPENTGLFVLIRGCIPHKFWRINLRTSFFTRLPTRYLAI